jgi:uncharacterized pyridoxamine 5'-phosphate oxidase family protein
VEKIINRKLDVPVMNQAEVDMPNVRIVEEPVEVIEEVFVPTEREKIVTVDIPNYREVEVIEDVEIEYPVERIVENEVFVDRDVDVEVVREVMVENRMDRTVDKLVELTKTVEKPVFNL